jgi:hypothetical protein
MPLLNGQRERSHAERRPEIVMSMVVVVKDRRKPCWIAPCAIVTARCLPRPVSCKDRGPMAGIRRAASCGCGQYE